jgi:hypothetical protein
VLGVVGCLVVRFRQVKGRQGGSRKQEERGKRPDVNVNVNVMTKMSTSLQVRHKAERIVRGARWWWM